MKRLYLIGLLLFCAVGGFAQDLRDSLQTFYKVGSSRIDTLFMRNGESMSSFFQRNLTRFQHPDFELVKVTVIGSSSPEGNLAFNESLALQRACSLADYLRGRLSLDDQQLVVTSAGVDWRKLTDLAMNAKELPNQQEVLDVLQKGYRHNERLWRLKRVNNRIPYRWMYKHLFPLLRQSQVVVCYEIKEKPIVKEVLPKEPEPVVVEVADTAETEVPMELPVAEPKPFYWALKTNGLYDALLIPNVGVELYAGKQWSVAANWMYAWWSNTGKDNFWRIYGGDVEVRRWFGKKAEEKPLQGHHLGVYGQLLTYDFETGGRGYMADKWNYTLGVSYGYSLPIAKRLNLDFTLGIGYWGGRYKEYLPVEGHYVWQSTKNRRWFGPTKAEVSLVWLLGHDNENKQKGGSR